MILKKREGKKYGDAVRTKRGGGRKRRRRRVGGKEGEGRDADSYANRWKDSL